MTFFIYDIHIYIYDIHNTFIHDVHIDIPSGMFGIPFGMFGIMPFVIPPPPIMLPNLDRYIDPSSNLFKFFFFQKKWKNGEFPLLCSLCFEKSEKSCRQRLLKDWSIYQYTRYLHLLHSWCCILRSPFPVRVRIKI